MNWKVRSVEILARLLRPGFSSEAAAALLCAPLKLAAPRKKVALDNIARALPESTPEERGKIVAQTYEHMVWTAIEFTALQKDPKQVLEWMEAENSELLDELNGKGAIILAGHIGNWELAAAWIAQSGHKITAIVRESDDESERGLIKNMRARVGVGSMSKKEPMMRSISLLRRGELLGILPDQHGGPEGMQVPLFGIETSTSQGAAVFAYLTKKPIVPFFTHRVAPFRHKIRFGPAIDWEKTGGRDECVYAITKKVNETVEQMILEAPGQWLAQHRRFRELCR